MRHLRVLVVDDSAMNRRMLNQMLDELPDVEVVGVAGDGEEALRLAASLAPDVITLDLEMPRMDGFAFLRLLMASRPTPVIVVSSHSDKDNVFRALELGAIDFIAKPDALLAADSGSVREQLKAMISVVRQLSPTSMRRQAPVSGAAPQEHKPTGAAAATRLPARLAVIAASTGGPTALLELFAGLPGDADACVVVAQHMPERFTHAFAERLDRAGPLTVAEAAGEVELHAGMGLVCPGGKSVEIVRSGGRLLAKVVAPEVADRYAPSADRLFRSAAAAMGPSVRGVVLTGMGEDGSAGALAIKNEGGEVMVESAQTAVVYGMPRAAEQTGAVRRSMPLPALGEWLARWMRNGEDDA